MNPPPSFTQFVWERVTPIQATHLDNFRLTVVQRLWQLPIADQIVRYCMQMYYAFWSVHKALNTKLSSPSTKSS